MRTAALLLFVFLSQIVPVRCQTTATWATQAESHRGKNGQRIAFVCPPNGVISSRVWGTDLYTDDSSICSCAVHAGLITAARGGVVTIQIEPSASAYRGSVRNGVTSQDYGYYAGSFRFVGQAVAIDQTAPMIDWGTAAQAMRGQNEQVFRFTCPSNGKITTRVWGTDLYTDDSSICTCAVHAGIISAVNGGEVAIRIKPGASSYAGSARNGVTTTAYGAYSGSYEFVSSGGQGGRGRPATGTRYRVENLVFNRPDVYQNPRNYHDFLIDFANGTVSEVNQETEQGRERIDILVFRPNRRVTIKTTNLTTGYWVEYDWVFQDDGRTIAGAWRDPGAWGPSVGGLSR